MGPEYYRQNWVKQLFANGFRINEPGINYPKFMRFCLNVYNWGDRTFNSYDPEYVVGTGKNWKLYLNSHNWAQSYALFFRRISMCVCSAMSTATLVRVSISWLWV